MTRALQILLLAGAAIAPATAAEQPLSIQPSFRLGDAGVLCSAQLRSSDVRLTGIFDRSYLLTCRDAAGPIGSVLAVRRPVDIATEPGALGADTLACKPAQTATIENVGAVNALHCRDEAAGIDYLRYATQRDDTYYLVEGLAGYDPALKLALASVVTDRQQSGSVQVATTEDVLGPVRAKTRNDKPTEYRPQ